MKKLLLILFVLASGLTLKAQSSFSLGPKIGFNSNTLTDNRDSIQSSIKNSFQVGAFVRMGSKVYFQPELNYQVMKGSMHKVLGITVLSQDYTLKTIKIPALIGVKLINKSGLNLRVMAGPAFTFITNKKLTPPSINTLWPIQSVDDLKNSNWSIQAGAGLDILFLTLDLRYEIGLANMYGGDSGFNVKDNTFNISLGFKLL